MKLWRPEEQPVPQAEARVIGKFPIYWDQPASLPRGSEVLSVFEEAGQLHLWASHTSEAAGDVSIMEARHIEIIGAGQPYDPRGRKFIGTVNASNRFIWHIFERTP